MGMLRLALALAVFLSHLPLATIHFIGGGVAVQGFFIVSGFYMSLVLGGKYSDTRLFYTNRLLRIFPSYVLMIGLGAIALFGLHASATATFDLFVSLVKHPGPTVVLVIENLVLVGQELLFWFKLTAEGLFVFDPTNTPSAESPVAWQLLLVPQAWSLSLELMFYALAPWLARRSTGTLIGVLVASIAFRFAGHWLPVDYWLWQGRLFPTVLFLFVAGMLAQRATPRVAGLRPAIGWGVTALLLALIVALPYTGLEGEPGRWVVYGAITLAIPFVFSSFQGVAFDRWIGDLSYPIYLTHLMMIGLVLTFEPPAGAWVAFAGTIALSCLLLWRVDHPVDRWRQARIARAKAAPAMSADVPGA